MSAGGGQQQVRKATAVAFKLPFGFSVVLGRSWRSIFTPLMGLSPEVIHAADLYIKAAVRLRRHASEASFLAYLEAAHRLDGKLQGLSGDYLEPIFRDVETRCLAYQTLGPKGVKLPQIRPRKVFQDRLDVLRDLDVARMQSRFSRNLRRVDKDLREARQLDLLPAFRKLSSVIGPNFDEAWAPVFEYLAKNETGIAQAMEKLKNARGPEAIAQAAKSVQGYHSKIKGLLGEAYVRRWKDWRDMKRGLKNLAMARVRELNRAARADGQGVIWSLLDVPPGKIRLEGQETWDEALLIVEEARSGAPYRRVEVFATAQVKVEKNLSALTQSWKDELREGAFFSKKAVPTLPVLSVENKGGGMDRFFVVPPDPDHRPIRWAFAPEGVKIAKEDVELLKRAGLQVITREIDRPIADFNVVADGLMHSLTLPAP
jgi:hypothetical protein